MNPFRFSLLVCAILLSALLLRAAAPEPTRTPLRVVADLDIGETQELTLVNGAKATVRLLSIVEQRDTLSDAVRGARVEVEVNRTRTTLGCATYHRPLTVAGVQIDC